MALSTRFLSADQSGAIPSHFLDLIKKVQEKEAKNYYERWRRQYFGHRDEFFASIRRLENVQATLTRNIETNPRMYPETLKEYIRTVALPILTNAQRAEEAIKKEETDINTWVEVKNREAFGYVLPSGEAKLQEVMKTTYPGESQGEELVSKINGKEKEMEEVLKNADRSFEVAKQIAKTTYTLVADFVVMGTDVAKGDRFPVYFAPCKAEFDRSIMAVNTYSSYLATLSNYASDYDALLKYTPVYRQRSSILREVSTCIRAYFKVLHFYEPNDAICKKNNRSVTALAEGLERYTNIVHS